MLAIAQCVRRGQGLTRDDTLYIVLHVDEVGRLTEKGFSDLRHGLTTYMTDEAGM